MSAEPAEELPPSIGAASIAFARESITRLFQGRQVENEPASPADPAVAAVFAARRGVFVTLRTYPDHDLRGCVGYPRAVLPLRSALNRAAVAAAVDDPRFPPVRPNELDRLVVEVSLLTQPVPLDEADRDHWPNQIEVGRHGLILEDRYHGGLLLPQVAPEQGWDSLQFLNGTCEKAGLPREAWRQSTVHVLTFEAIVFEEDRPGGSVHRQNARPS